MFQINEDNSIYVTRGDSGFINVTAKDKAGNPYTFMPGETLRMKVFAKKNCEKVVLQKDFPITEVAQTVQIFLDEKDTKIGGVISKPVTYWYELELNPLSNPQTIIGYGEDGPVVFMLYPEGRDLPEDDPIIQPEDIPIVDTELDLFSKRPVENQVIARAILRLEKSHEKTHEAVAELHVTPEMFGAIGDGVADDTEALQKAIENSAGTTLRLGDGVYKLNGQVVISAITNIEATAAIITGRGLRVTGADVTVKGVTFKDITTNAIVCDAGAKIHVDRCAFENIGTSSNLDKTHEGCAVYANACAVKVTDTKFTKCRGHGAVYCYNGGFVEIKDSRFTENYYRAIVLYGNGISEGVISRNYIEDCGKPNTSGSGVGCNGIYSTNGGGVVVENNTILRCRENAIEGVFLKVLCNYIDGTGVEVDTKPTPSIEGIFVLPKQPAYIANNIILNARGYGIKTYTDKAITEPIFIIGNIIKGCKGGSIDINSPISVSNVHVADNVVDSTVNINNCNDTDVYIGDVGKLYGKPDISKNKAIFDYHHYFDVLEPFTNSNCAPAFETESGVSCVRVAYQEYAKIIYSLPALKGERHMLRFAVLGKGKFNVNLMKNGAYDQSIVAVDSNDYVEKSYTIPINGTISDKYKINIEFQETSCIRTADIQLYR